MRTNFGVEFALGRLPLIVTGCGRPYPPKYAGPSPGPAGDRVGVARGSELGGVAGETREVVLLVDHQEVEDEFEQIGVSCRGVPVHCHYPDVIAGLLSIEKGVWSTKEIMYLMRLFQLPYNMHIQAIRTSV